MKSVLSKSISLIVVVVFVASLFAGCGNAAPQTSDNSAAGTTAAATTAAATTAAPTVSEESKLVRIAVRDNYAGIEFNKDSIAYMEEKTNTKLEWIRMVPDTMEDKLNLLLASGDRPEIVQYYADTFEYKLVDSNLLLPLNDILDTKAPNLKKEWGDTIWDAMKHPDGKIYAIPYKGVSLVDWSMGYRKDWLDKLSLAIPKTIDEYYNVALAVSNNDPDGNGKKDTFAFGSHDGYKDKRYMDHVFMPYGTLVNQWMEVDGKIVNGSVLPGAKEGLKMMKKLYDAKAIDPEFITDDETRVNQKYTQGIYGAANFYTSMIEPMWGYYQEFKKNNPNGEWVLADQPMTSSFTAKPVGQPMLPRRGWVKTSLVNGSKNVDAAIRLVDWYATDEGADYYNYGVPGVDFNEDASGRVTMITQPDKYQEKGVCVIWLVCRDLAKVNDPNFVKAMTETNLVNAVPRANEGLMVPEATKYDSDLTKFVEEQFVKMTVGEIPIEGGFESFVTEWNKRGGQQYTDALNKAMEQKKAAGG